MVNTMRREKPMKRFLMVVLCIFVMTGIFGLTKDLMAAGPYPNKPITFIVPLEAGSDGDILVRPLCQKASTVLNQPVVVINKPGGGSTIGALELHDAKPDGYTIGMNTITIVTNKLQGLMPYDYRDFTLVGTFYTVPNDVFGSTRTKRPFKTILEAISFAKANPGELSIATGGIGQSIWIGAMAFITGTGIKANVIPQSGAGGLVVAQVAGGHTDLGVLSIPAARPQMDAGNVRFPGVLGTTRAPAPYDNVPTLKELGYDAVWESFGLVMGPPKMPTEVTKKLAEAFEIAAKDPQYHKFILERFTMPFYLPPDKIVPFCDERRKVVRNIMDKVGILKEK